MGHKGDDWRRIFAWRYRSALLAVAFVFTVASLVQLRMINAERERAEVITMAAEQAALSQRIAFLVASLDPEASSCTQVSVCSEIQYTADRMARNHAILTGEQKRGGFGAVIAPLEPIYAAGTTAFSKEVRAFTIHASALATMEFDDLEDRRALVISVKSAGSNTIMQTHGLIVEVLEAEARRAIKLVSTVGLVAWAAALSLLGILSLKVFRPMATRLGVTLNQMEDARNEAIAFAAKAERANKARAEFLKSASHELKTPLNAIMGLSEVMKEGRDGADQMLSEMAHATDHLLSTLNTMLDTHRLDEGRLELAREPVEIAAVLRNTAEIARDVCAKKGLLFVARIDVPDDLIATSDPSRLKQVCLNLLDNAVRFTKKGQVTFRARMDGEQRLCLTIADTGIGISEARMAAVFTRYSAQPVHRSAVAGGIGLGLSLTKTLVEMMKGEISVSSKLGKGTTFEVALPLDVAREAAPSACAMREAPLILVADDNRPNRLVADAMMQMLGGRTVMTVNGKEALERAKKEPFDLILMDIAMPVMDGVAATKAIRASCGPNQNTPIIAVTAHVAPEDTPALIEQGFQAVVHKPVRKSLMSDILSQYIGDRLGDDEASQDAG